MHTYTHTTAKLDNSNFLTYKSIIFLFLCMKNATNNYILLYVIKLIQLITKNNDLLFRKKKKYPDRGSNSEPCTSRLMCL